MAAASCTQSNTYPWLYFLSLWLYNYNHINTNTIAFSNWVPFSCFLVCKERGISRLVYTSTINVAFTGQPIEDGDEESRPCVPLNMVSKSQYNIYGFACYGLCLLGKIMHLNRVSMLSISVFRPLLKNQIYCRPDGPRSQRMRAKRLGCMKPPWRNILNHVLYVIIVMFWPLKWPQVHSTVHFMRPFP